MERWVAKVIAIIITFIIPFVFTMIPYVVHGFIARKGKAGERAICYLMCFGGGIFFGTFLLHMGPEVRQILDDYLLRPHKIQYPVTDLIIGAGFFFVLFLEKFVMKLNKKSTEKTKRKQTCQIYQTRLNQIGAKSGTKISICDSCANNRPCLGSTTIINGRMSVNMKGMAHSNTSQHIENSSVVELTEFRIHLNGHGYTPNNTSANQCSNDSTSNHLGHSDSSHHHNETSADHRTHHSHHKDDDEVSHHNMRSMILVLALSLHHLFEGLTIGLQKSITLLVTLVIAIMCHEAIISFSVGLNFVKCKYSLKKHLVTTLLVSLIMPIGEAIGIVMSEIGSESDALELASGVLQAFSAGTFLFVTFFEIFQEEISPHDTSMGKVTSAFIGFIVMALLMLMLPAPAGNDLETGVNHTTPSLWL